MCVYALVYFSGSDDWQLLRLDCQVKQEMISNYFVLQKLTFKIDLSGGSLFGLIKSYATNYPTYIAVRKILITHTISLSVTCFDWWHWWAL